MKAISEQLAELAEKAAEYERISAMSQVIMPVKKTTLQQMSLKAFRECYGIPENTVRELIHAQNFPAYKIGGRIYVDIPAFEKWREIRRMSM